MEERTMTDEEHEEILSHYGFSRSQKAALRRLKGMTCGAPD